MNDRDMSANDVVRWLRQKANRFAQMADEIERALIMGEQAAGGLALCGEPSACLGDQIWDLLGNGRSSRAAKIAKVLRESETAVKLAIKRDARLQVGSRGWIRRIEADEDSETTAEVMS